MDIKSVIFIRRDNIGDLVCTTPAISAFRLRYPRARIGVLVNSYNAPVIQNNPDVNDIFVYEKAKHSASGRLRVFLENIRVIRRIRISRFEVAVGCGYGFSRRLARFTALTGAETSVGYAGGADASKKFYNAPVAPPAHPMHEVEAMMALLKPLGVEGHIPPLFVRADAGEAAKAELLLKQAGLKKGERPIVFHISSRKPQNRWPAERFKELGDRVQEELGLKVLLLWSPGSASNRFHPGDDEKAMWIVENMKTKPLLYRTETLPELIAAISLAKTVVCCDGGAMHIAAGLGKPILTIWGSTDVQRWAPWGVPHLILRKGTGLAESTDAVEVFDAFKKLHQAGKKRPVRHD